MAYEQGDLFRRGSGIGETASPVFHLAPNVGWDDSLNERLGYDSTFMGMAEGFFESGGNLAKECLEEDGRVDLKFYPLLYMHWHGAELALKQLIRWWAHLHDGKDPKDPSTTLEEGEPTGHFIFGKKGLWPMIQPRLKDLVLDDRGAEIVRPALMIDEVEAVLLDLDKFDSGGFAFRYPKTKAGVAYMKGLEALDVHRVCTTLLALGATFISWLQAAKGAVEEYELSRRNSLQQDS